MYPGIILSLLGGLAIFLYGISTMGEGLKATTGHKIRSVLEKVTHNSVLGVITGALVTAMVQSSSGTIVMAISFINAGLLTVRQAVGIIMGANIGMTITAQLIAFRIPAYVFLSTITLGMTLRMLSKDRAKRTLGKILIGFGFIFLGMDIMRTSVVPLQQSPDILHLLTVLGANPFLGMLTGTGITALIHSGATIGILQAFGKQSMITLAAALPILVGVNLGSSVTTLMVSANSTLAARRAALVHLLFNLIGAVLFLLFLTPVLNIIAALGGDMARQIANAHTILNVGNTLVQLPFAALLVTLATRILPAGEEELMLTGPKILDRGLFHNPDLALSIVKDELKRMSGLVEQQINIANEAFIKGDLTLIKQLLDTEEEINSFKFSLINFLIELSGQQLETEQTSQVTLCHQTVNSLENIGDHCKSIAKLAQLKATHGIKFDQEPVAHLHYLKEVTLDNYREVTKVFFAGDIEQARLTLDRADDIDKLIGIYRSDYLCHLNQGDYGQNFSLIFIDALNHMRRINDYTFLITNSMQPLAD